MAETQESNPILQPHSNAVVPHTISDHTMAVQTSVMVDGKWVNLVDTNDINNLDLDLHKVAQVVQNQVSKIADVESNANSAVEQAEAAQEASNTNQVAIDNMDSAVKAAQANIASQSATVGTIQTDLSAAKQQIKDADSDIKQAQSDIKTNANAISDNAGNIASVTSTASKLSSNMTDAQGDISTLQQLATGFKADIADNKGNISSLQTGVKGLSDTVSNLSSDNTTNKQNISTLQNTANGFTNTVATLQTQVNNSAVGTNLVMNSEQEFSGKANDFHDYNLASLTALTPGETYTMSFSAKVDDKAVNCKQHVFVDVHNSSWSFYTVTDAPISTDYQRVTYTFTVPEDITDASFITVYLDHPTINGNYDSNSDKSDAAGTGYIKEFKLEKGDHATDWCPNPADNATVTSVSTLTNTVNGLSSTVIDNKGDISTLKNTTSGLSSTITQVSNKADQNTTLISNLTQTVDGIQSTVKNKADQSTVSQLASQLLAKVSTKDFQSEIALMQNDLNLRVSKGDVISQLNLEAGGDGLIQVANGKGKLYLDADSVVFSGEAFIPSAAITDIQADKITSGTLDAGLINVKNFSANDITTGTLTGIDIRTDNGEGQTFALKDATLIWQNNSKIATLGQGTVHSTDFTDISDEDFSIISDSSKIVLANGWFDSETNKMSTSQLYPNLVMNFQPFGDGTWSPDHDEYSFGVQTGPGASFRMYQSKDDSDDDQTAYNSIWFTAKHSFNIDLASDSNLDTEPTPGQYNSSFRIHKDNCIGAYFGEGSNGNQINFVSVGNGCGFNVNGSLHVTGSKNSVVQTAQGWLAINAYETAEYYFGDIGESNTGNQSKVTIGIDRIFNETVNTNIQYQVFITPYSDAHVWVEQRYHNRFIVCSDKPNAEFGWEIKAKRKGYEDHRLRKVDTDFEPSSALNKGDF